MSLLAKVTLRVLFLYAVFAFSIGFAIGLLQ